MSEIFALPLKTGENRFCINYFQWNYKAILIFWRLGSLLLYSCIDFTSNSFLIAFLILSVSITLAEGSDRLFSKTQRSGAVCTGI